MTAASNRQLRFNLRDILYLPSFLDTSPVALGKEASPYFWPIYWLLRNRIRTRTNRDIKKAMRDAWKGKR